MANNFTFNTCAPKETWDITLNEVEYKVPYFFTHVGTQLELTALKKPTERDVSGVVFRFLQNKAEAFVDALGELEQEDSAKLLNLYLESNREKAEEKAGQPRPLG